MVEPNFSIKIEFVLQQIKEKFLGDYFVNSRFRKCYSSIFNLYREQLKSKDEFIHLRTIFQNFTVDLYEILYYSKSIKHNYLEETVLKYGRELKQAFSPEHLNAVRYSIAHKSYYLEKNANSAKIFAIIIELYELWRSLQTKLIETKSLLPEDNNDFELEINRLLLSEISEIEKKISNLEKKIITRLNNLYLLYSNKNIFLEINTNFNDVHHSLSIDLLLRKYSQKAELAGWNILIFSELDNGVILEIRGCFVFEELCSEAGIHQANRYELDNILNQFELNKSYFIHNNQADIIENKSKHILAQVNIIPQPDWAEILEIDPKDLKIKERIANPGCGVQYRFLTIAHQPTKIEATICDRSPSKALAMKNFT